MACHARSSDPAHSPAPARREWLIYIYILAMTFPESPGSSHTPACQGGGLACLLLGCPAVASPLCFTNTFLSPDPPELDQLTFFPGTKTEGWGLGGCPPMPLSPPSLFSFSQASSPQPQPQQPGLYALVCSWARGQGCCLMALSPQVCLTRSHGCRDLVSREGLWRLPPQPSWTALTTVLGQLAPREVLWLLIFHSSRPAKG